MGKKSFMCLNRVTQQHFSLPWFNTYSRFLIQNDNHNLIVGICPAQL